MRRARRRHPFKIQFKRMQAVIAAFIGIAVFLYFVQRNVSYEQQERLMEPVDQAAFSEEEPQQEAECLILWQGDESGQNGLNLMKSVLSQMKIPYDTCEGSLLNPAVLGDYETAVLSMTQYNLLGEGLLDLLDWVEAGGRLLVLYPPDTNGIFQSITRELGIERLGGSMAVIEKLHFARPLMIGGQGKDYTITDPYESALVVNLDDSCQVYLESADETAVPLIWKKPLGEGSVVVNNMGFLEKAYLGFYSASYSLLTDVCAYPVINASTFYIDDFPSPVPAGSSQFIEEDYGMSISDFYTQVWWNDIYNLGKEYGIRYTGLVIEQYSDQVEGEFERNTDTQRFRYFGNMLLDAGGEIGFHGYNHMPLCLLGFDYGGDFESYRLWPSPADMEAGMRELEGFCRELFPDEEFRVYVPPSNIISQEGRQMLREKFPEIVAIASIYLPGAVEYAQEFRVEEDGMISTPRVISGYVLDDYMQIAALSELNFHFVNSHFQHPDDVLDVDRGANLGWEELYSRLSAYTEWLYTSAPDIRTLTGTEMAAAVQIYDAIGVERELSDGKLTLNLTNFLEEAWFLVRINEGEPGSVTGGTLTEVEEDLYLLEAQAPQVEIAIR